MPEAPEPSSSSPQSWLHFSLGFPPRAPSTSITAFSHSPKSGSPEISHPQTSFVHFSGHSLQGSSRINLLRGSTHRFPAWTPAKLIVLDVSKESSTNMICKSYERGTCAEQIRKMVPKCPAVGHVRQTASPCESRRFNHGKTYGILYWSYRFCLWG